jgi:hypothetical protein
MLLRGAEPRIILLFGLPLLIAVINLQPTATVAHRIAAGTFLALLAIGAIISRDQTLFPKLGGIARNGLAPQHDRMLSGTRGFICFLYSLLCRGLCLVGRSRSTVAARRRRSRGSLAIWG